MGECAAFHPGLAAYLGEAEPLHLHFHLLKLLEGHELRTDITTRALSTASLENFLFAFSK